MTLRTTSATRRRVVSRSSDVASTSATSSRRDSAGDGSVLETTELMLVMIGATILIPPRAGISRPNEFFRVASARYGPDSLNESPTTRCDTVLHLLKTILVGPRKCLQDFCTFPRNRVRTRPRIRPEF